MAEKLEAVRTADAQLQGGKCTITTIPTISAGLMSYIRVIEVQYGREWKISKSLFPDFLPHPIRRAHSC
jgi:hypothetical protein